MIFITFLHYDKYTCTCVVQLIRRVVLRGIAELIDLDMHYLRISTITVKILNQFRMQIEYVAERARKVHDRESI